MAPTGENSSSSSETEHPISLDAEPSATNAQNNNNNTAVEKKEVQSFLYDTVRKYERSMYEQRLLHPIVFNFVMANFCFSSLLAAGMLRRNKMHGTATSVTFLGVTLTAFAYLRDLDVRYEPLPPRGQALLIHEAAERKKRRQQQQQHEEQQQQQQDSKNAEEEELKRKKELAKKKQAEVIIVFFNRCNNFYNQHCGRCCCCTFSGINDHNDDGNGNGNSSNNNHTQIIHTNNALY
eukprot:GEZU01018177.1.p1 GENE.GEZU01018177.1~~GEZU01018177.1.p1  ORF type:complete len:236 (+),score=70.89 GEZU01018177.1:81-788(+)